MSLELARSLSATEEELDKLVEEYSHYHRDLAEALFLNSSLSSKSLSRLLDLCPADLGDLALKHRNLSAPLQHKVLDKALEGAHKTRVKLILLERVDLDPGLFSLFLIDRDNVIRTKAQLRCAT